MKKIKAVFISVVLVSIFGMRLGAESQAIAPTEHSHEHSSAVKEFTVVAIEYYGTKVWVPGTLIVKKGDKVKIKLINNIKSDPNTHGYAIDEFGVKTVVARGTPETIEFSANQAGLFTIYCQLHPAHIGGQLLILE